MKKASFSLLLSALLLAISCTNQPAEPPQVSQAPKPEPAKAANRFFNEVVGGTHQPAVLDELLAADFLSHHFPAPNSNKAAFSGGIGDLLAGFPDIHCVVSQQYEEGDKVFTYAYWEGTHTGAFMGIPATGKKVHVEFMDIWRVENGKIRENWVCMDILGLLVQLGVVPPPGAGK